MTVVKFIVPSNLGPQRVGIRTVVCEVEPSGANTAGISIPVEVI